MLSFVCPRISFRITGALGLAFGLSRLQPDGFLTNYGFREQSPLFYVRVWTFRAPKPCDAFNSSYMSSREPVEVTRVNRSPRPHKESTPLRAAHQLPHDGA